jgi:hypothetical protein
MILCLITAWLQQFIQRFSMKSQAKDGEGSVKISLTKKGFFHDKTQKDTIINYLSNTLISTKMMKFKWLTHIPTLIPKCKTT